MFEFFESALEHLGTFPFGQLSLTVWALILLALLFDFLNGLHDAANSIATVVSTRVLAPQWAVLWAAFFNFIAFVIFPLKVAGTIQGDIVDQSLVRDPVLANYLIAATLMAACGWNILTWYLGLPTSSSHALIGGMVGAAVTLTGSFDKLKFGGLAWICMFIVLAPLIGMFLGGAIMSAVSWLFLRSSHAVVDRIFRWGQLLSAGFFSLGHGGNDAQKTMGIIFVLLVAASNAHPDHPWLNRYRLDEATLARLAGGDTPLSRDVLARVAELRAQRFDTKEHLQAALKQHLPTDDYERHQARIVAAADRPQVPTEVVLLCHLAMGLGTLMGGWRIVKTMGQRISRLRPVDGFCAETGAALTLAFATFYKGIPVSTTHTITGAIIGVSALKRISSVRWGVAGRVVWAWILTIPGAALMAAISVFILKVLF
jgi:PiT family inorganic phosphate transporter